MATTTKKPLESLFPVEFIEAVRLMAERDAFAVSVFWRTQLAAVYGDTVEQSVLHFPRETLMGIAWAIRFKRWELQNIQVHLDAGLPSATELMAEISREFAGPRLSKFVNTVAVGGLRVFQESILWSLDDYDLRGDIAIVAVENDDFLDSIADFLLGELKLSEGR